jgi:hypothetical protein
MKTIKLIVLFALLTLGGCDGSSNADFEDTYVVEAFLFEGEIVDDIRITLAASTLDENPLETPVNSAAVVLTRGAESFSLQPSGDDGYYHYQGTDLEIRQGDTFTLTATVGGTTLTSDTTVPKSPTGVLISRDEYSLPDFNVNPFLLRELLQSRPEPITVTWDNPLQEYYFVAIRVPALENPDYILPDFIRDRFGGFERITEPTKANYFEVPFIGLEVFGQYTVSVYQINTEYAALYESREQDSRDLNEPFSNIKGGVGIFSAFSTAITSFTLVKE